MFCIFFMMGVIGRPYGLPIKGYWQTVTVCQLEIIGRPFTKFVKVMPKSSCWQTPVALYNKPTITACSKDCGNALVPEHIF